MPNEQVGLTATPTPRRSSLRSSSGLSSARRPLLATVVAAAALLSACSSGDGGAQAAADSVTVGASAVQSDQSGESGETPAVFDSTVVHDIQIEFDQTAYEAMVDTFTTTGEKDWIEATVVIDGQEYQQAGVRLKGNSSLFGLNQTTAGNPEDLPWLIRLDKYVDGQTHQDYGDLVIRSNSTETSMNEAVALELLEASGLAAEQAIATSFTVNGGETELRLAIEHPDETWDAANFGVDDGLLYKADSEGDYSYRGDDPESYVDVFDQKAGEDDLEPLIDFLDFINNADDQSFADELDSYLDTEAFATYLAFQDLIGNADDINGRGNNSYLHYDQGSGLFTVVSWDLNLAFDTANVSGGAGGPDAGAGAGAGRPARPEGGAGAGGAGGPGDQPNVLVDRFMANSDFSQLYDDKTGELTESLFTSGMVNDVIATWTNLLAGEADDLVTDAVVAGDAGALTAYASGIGSAR